MRRYRLYGTHYKPHTYEPVQFSQEIKAKSAKLAMDQGREQLYNSGSDRILYRSVFVWKRKHWQEIPMMKALELE